MRFPRPVLCAAALAGLARAALPAAVVLPPLFSDHMVLQKSAGTRVWGTAAPGETVRVAVAGASGEAVAGSDGAWRLDLDLSGAGPGPFTLEARGGSSAPVVVNDVAVGEVWLASGQSNMEFSLQRALGGPEEAAASADPLLREFRVAAAAVPEPGSVAKGAWKPAGPATSGGFSAVAYYMAKGLRGALNEPVGIIHASWGGTPIAAWTSAEALDAVPSLAEAARQARDDAAQAPARQAAYAAAYAAWSGQFDRADLPGPPDAAPAGVPGWKPVASPGHLSASGLPDAGIVWLRRKVVLSPAPGSLEISLDAPGGFETVYWNGTRVGGLDPAHFPGTGLRHRFRLPDGAARAGENLLELRLYAPAGGAALNGVPSAGTVDLRGEWDARAEKEWPPLAVDAARGLPPSFAAAPELQHRPAHLYNGMIAPLVPFTIRGAVWYQGEHDTPQAFSYREALPALIGDWRRRWGDDFPFLLCQLPAMGEKREVPGDGSWAEMRESQSRAMSLPGTGEAILCDLGDAENVHPRDKKDPGGRLALAVLAKAYGLAEPASPVFDSATVEGDAVRVRFRDVTRKLVAKPLPATYSVSSLAGTTRPLIRNSPGSEVDGFAVCGADRKWGWADARIDGDSVVVRSAEVPRPLYVRYAWADNPTANLYGEEGLPAAPFRTDDFPVPTQPKRGPSAGH